MSLFSLLLFLLPPSLLCPSFSFQKHVTNHMFPGPRPGMEAGDPEGSPRTPVSKYSIALTGRHRWRSVEFSLERESGSYLVVSFVL